MKLASMIPLSAFPVGRETVAEREKLLQSSKFHWPIDDPPQEITKGRYRKVDGSFTFIRGVDGRAIESRGILDKFALAWKPVGCPTKPWECQ